MSGVRLNLLIPQTDKDQIRELADARGQTLTAALLSAVRFALVVWRYQRDGYAIRAVKEHRAPVNIVQL